MTSSDLEQQRRGRAGEVEALEHVSLGIVLSAVALDHDGLGGSLFTNEQHALGLFGDALDKEVSADVVDVWNENGQVVRDGVGRVVVVGHALVPVLPLARFIGDELVDRLVARDGRERQATLVREEEVL